MGISNLLSHPVVNILAHPGIRVRNISRSSLSGVSIMSGTMELSAGSTSKKPASPMYTLRPVTSTAWSWYHWVALLVRVIGYRKTLELEGKLAEGNLSLG